MRKILLALALMTTTMVTNAASTTGVLNIDGTVTSSCAVTFSNNISFTLIPNSTPGGQLTTLTIACTAGSQINDFTATSANGWQLKSTTNPTSTDVVAYGIDKNYVYPVSYADVFGTQWYGTGPLEPTVELLNNGAPFTIANDGAPIEINLTVMPLGNIIPPVLNVGAYSDTVTYALSY